MNEDDKLVIDAMARMGELAIRGEADKALIAELVEALQELCKQAKRTQSIGAQTGPHWTHLAIASLKAESVLARAKAKALK